MTRHADLLGIVNSALCLVHCLAMPVLVAMGAAFLHEPIVSLLFIALAGWAVHEALRGGDAPWFKGYLWGMWGLFGSSLLLEEVHPVVQLVSLLASAGLVAGHTYHWSRASLRMRRT
jgi:hypothetical protein